MIEPIYYCLFLVLFVFGAVSFFTSWRELFFCNNELVVDPLSVLQPDDDEISTSENKQGIDSSVFSPPITIETPQNRKEDVTKEAMIERNRINREHHEILVLAVQELLSDEPITIDQIYNAYVKKCHLHGIGKDKEENYRGLDKPHSVVWVRHYVKYELVNKSKIAQFKVGRKVFYVEVDQIACEMP